MAQTASIKAAEATIGGAELVVADSMDLDAVLELLREPETFFSSCKILGEDDFIQYADPTPAQVQVLRATAAHRWILVNKYRQAKITTCAAIGVLLRDCMYGRGISGIVIAQDQPTSEMAFERILYAYDTLPDKVKAPLSTGKKKGTQHIAFWHGGSIRVLTMGSRTPGVGRGISRILITEIGESIQQRRMMIGLFPAFNKRPNARVIVESTPGRSGSPHEHMWRASLDGRGRFHPVFLKWWLDNSCVAAPPDGADAAQTTEERVYTSKHDGITTGHVYFRRLSLENEFVGDPRLFGAKYPSDAHDGWVGSLNPTLPSDVIKNLLAESVREADAVDAGYGCVELEPPDETQPYLVTADPSGFGESGDPSAFTVWNAHTGIEVAFWEGREDPSRFASRCMRVQARYAGNDERGALLAVESNAAACVSSLKDRGCKRLLWTNRYHPGWYATAQRLQAAEERLVKMLRSGELTVRSRKVLHQLLDYDGSRRDARVSNDFDEVHHFDLARTCVIAADVLSSRRFYEDAEEPKRAPRRPGTLPASFLDDMKKSSKARRTSLFGPPPRK